MYGCESENNSKIEEVHTYLALYIIIMYSSKMRVLNPYSTK